MPTYEYACRNCGEHLEVVQSFSDDPLTECPDCGGALRKVFGTIGITFKGSGFYKTDSRSAVVGQQRLVGVTGPRSVGATAPRRRRRNPSDGETSGSSRATGELVEHAQVRAPAPSRPAADRQSARRPDARRARRLRRLGLLRASSTTSRRSTSTRRGARRRRRCTVGDGRRPPGRLPPPPRPAPRAPAPPGQLPGQRLGPARARRRAALRPRAPPARCSRTSHPGDFVVLRPARRPHVGPARHLLRRAGRPPRGLRRPVLPRAAAVALAGGAGRAACTVHDGGTVVVVQGPRFSTRAESRWYRGQGWDVVNMTQYPEAVLARELGLCYAAIALVTDYDTGVEGDAGRRAGVPGARCSPSSRRTCTGCATCSWRRSPSVPHERHLRLREGARRGALPPVAQPRRQRRTGPPCTRTTPRTALPPTTPVSRGAPMPVHHPLSSSPRTGPTRPAPCPPDPSAALPAGGAARPVPTGSLALALAPPDRTRRGPARWARPRPEPPAWAACGPPPSPWSPCPVGATVGAGDTEVRSAPQLHWCPPGAVDEPADGRSGGATVHAGEVVLGARLAPAAASALAAALPRGPGAWPSPSSRRRCPSSRATWSTCWPPSTRRWPRAPNPRWRWPGRRWSSTWAKRR